MSDGRPRGQMRATLRLVGVLVLGVAVVSLLRQGDLLGLPAIALVVATWALLGLSALAVPAWRSVRRAAPRLGALAREVWRAIGDEPELRPLSQVGRRGVRALAWLQARWTTLGNCDVVRLVAVVVAAAAVVGIGTLWWLVRAMPPAFDRRYVDLATRLQVDATHRAMLGLTGLGGTWVIAALLAGMSVALLWLRDRRGAMLVAAPAALAISMTTVLKLAVARQRPALGQLVETTRSWPSGHTTAGLAVTLGVVLVAARRGWRWRRVAAAVVPLGLMIGYSRAYLTVHWLTDVAAGWLVATFATATVMAVMGSPRNAAPLPRRLAPRHAWPAGTAATLAMLLVAIASSRGIYPAPPNPPPEALATSNPVLPGLDADPFSRTLLGRSMEPINLIIVADLPTFHKAAEDSGWSIADDPTLARLVQTYQAGLRRRADPTAPVTPTFYGVRMQDLAIQQQTSDQGVRARHHARFWNQGIRLANGCSVWYGTSSLDDRIEWNWHTLIPEHHIAAAIDVEREHVATSLTADALLTRRPDHTVAAPTLGSNAANDPFFTDGNAAVLVQSRACT